MPKPQKTLNSLQRTRAAQLSAESNMDDLIGEDPTLSPLRVRPEEPQDLTEVLDPALMKAIERDEQRTRSRLLPMQRALFAEFFVLCNDPYKAALRAGYNPKNGPLLMKLPEIAEHIAIRKAQRDRYENPTKEEIVTELAAIGFANASDYVTFDHKGDPAIALSRLTREQWAAVAEVTVEDFVEGRGDDARDVRRVKFKLHDKRAALTDVAKLQGYQPNRKLELTGKDGTPLVGDAPTPEEIARRVAFMLHSAAEASA